MLTQAEDSRIEKASLNFGFFPLVSNTSEK